MGPYAGKEFDAGIVKMPTMQHYRHILGWSALSFIVLKFDITFFSLGI